MAHRRDEIADSRVPGLLLLLVRNGCLVEPASCPYDCFADYDHGASFSRSSRAIKCVIPRRVLHVIY